ncbi:MAG TPA: hypothetical protein VE596_18240 [Gaiellaceae bacterium]|nr:hypothetical protein [Gaiellaceae bacterium]
MRPLAQIEAEIDKTARHRAELWRAAPLSDEDVFTVIRLTDRLRDLWDEKREAVAGDQVTARRRANDDPTKRGSGGYVAERPERRPDPRRGHIDGGVRLRLGLPQVYVPSDGAAKSSAA